MSSLCGGRDGVTKSVSYFRTSYQQKGTGSAKVRRTFGEKEKEIKMLMSRVWYWLMRFWQLEMLRGKGYAPLERFALGRTHFVTVLLFAIVFDAV